MDKNQQISQYCRQLKTPGIAAAIDRLIAQAEANGSGFKEYTLSLFHAEAEHRHQNEVRRRLKTARLPPHSDLGTYDHTF